MIRYLLDTNTVSYFIRGMNDGLVARMERGFNAQNIAISAVTRAELRFGVVEGEKLAKFFGTHARPFRKQPLEMVLAQVSPLGEFSERGLLLKMGRQVFDGPGNLAIGIR